MFYSVKMLHLLLLAVVVKKAVSKVEVGVKKPKKPTSMTKADDSSRGSSKKVRSGKDERKPPAVGDVLFSVKRDCGGTTGNRSKGEEGQRIWNRHQFTKGHKEWLEKEAAKIKRGQGYTDATSRALRQYPREMAKLLKENQK